MPILVFAYSFVRWRHYYLCKLLWLTAELQPNMTRRIESDVDARTPIYGRALGRP